MKHNCYFLYVDSNDQPIRIETFFDPHIKWEWDKKKRRWYLNPGFGGTVMEWWLKENPMPTRPP